MTRPPSRPSASAGGKKHMDRNTDEQVETKNIVVIKTRESRANDGYEGNVHLLYATEGSGDAFIYMDGKEIEGTWEKDSRTDCITIPRRIQIRWCF